MRPFIFQSCSLSDFHNLDAASPTVAEAIEKILDQQIESILSQLPNSEKLPLVRLSVDITGFPSISPPLFGAKYVGRIANPNSLLYPRRKRALTLGAGGEEEGMGIDESMSSSAQFDMMVGFIEAFLKEQGGLKILNAMHMRDTCLFGAERVICVVSQYVNKRCSMSWHMMMEHFDHCAKDVLDKVDTRNATPDSLVQLVKEAYEKDSTQYLEALAYVRSIKLTHRSDMHDDDDKMEEEEVPESAPKRRATSYLLFIFFLLTLRKRAANTRRTQ